jgi:hypothetical protein
MARILTKTVAALAASAAAAGTALLVGAWAPGDPSGTQTFNLVTRQVVRDPVYRAVASGVFSATGTMQAQGTASNAPLKATFPGGTFLLTETSGGKPAATINSTTCAVRFAATGVQYKLSGGTGSYKGISGSGTATVRFTGVLPKLSDGKCDTSSSAEPKAGTLVSTVHASGPVTLP